MKTTFFFRALCFCFISLGILLAGTSCEPNEMSCFDSIKGTGFDLTDKNVCPAKNQIPSELMLFNGKPFDGEKFKQVLKDNYDGKVMGYAYAVVYMGDVVLSGGEGHAHRLANGVNYPQSGCKISNIASVSKTITTVAMLKILDEAKINRTASVADYLPKEWKTSPFAAVTFHHLLSHTSGIQSDNWGNTLHDRLEWGGLKTSVEAGPIADSMGNYKYMNANFALMRVLIPMIWKNILKTAPDYGAVSEANHVDYYRDYVMNNVLIPAGAKNASLFEDAYCESTYGYEDYESYNKPGKEYNQDAEGWDKMAGGSGWSLSAEELALAYYNFFNNESINTAANQTLMKTQATGYGFTGRGASDITGMSWYQHGGYIYGLKSAATYYEDGVTIVIYVNSLPSEDPGYVSRVAYNAAWQ